MGPTVTVPMRPDIVAEAGTWTYEISGADELKLTVREDSPSTSGESNLLLQPYLVSGESYNFDSIWQMVEGLYTNNNLNVTIGQTSALVKSSSVLSPTIFSMQKPKHWLTKEGLMPSMFSWLMKWKEEVSLGLLQAYPDP